MSSPVNNIRQALSLCLFALLFSCGPSFAELIERRTSNSFASTQAMEVFFATVRSTNPAAQVACSNAYFMVFGNQVQKTGSCVVSVPADREVGEIPFGLGGKDKFFQFLEHRINAGNLSVEESENLWWKKIEADPFEEIIVFVHGFNVGFEEAILRAAQLKYDLKFPGRVVTFTWPAGGDASLLSSLLLKNTYEKNMISARSSRESFKIFLKRMIKTGKKSICWFIRWATKSHSIPSRKSQKNLRIRLSMN